MTKGLKPLKIKAFSPKRDNLNNLNTSFKKVSDKAYSTGYIRYIGVFKCFWENAVHVVQVVNINAAGAGWHGMAHSDVLY